MLHTVKKYIDTNCSLADGSKVLVALSGGIDSVVLLDIMLQCGYQVHAAHCNFHLRGQESERDMTFVQNLCVQQRIPLYVKHFDTANYSNTHKVSVEVAARELRYEWFNELCVSQHFDAIAVAHHKNDQAETVIHNLVRGTGLKGLRGMLPQNGSIVRPLLCLTRKQIEQYAETRQLNFVSDSSNNSDDYQRNVIRHHVIPTLETLNPDVVNRIAENASNASDQWRLLEELVAGLNIVRQEDELTLLCKTTIKKHSPSLLHYLLEPFGFTPTAIRQLYDCLDKPESKHILSHTHLAYTDKSFVVVEPRELTKPAWSFNIEYVSRNQLKTLVPPTPTIAYFDADKLHLPLTARNIKDGDRFRPLGMKGTKKVHDYLIDNKISIAQRRNTIVLCDNCGKIIWLMPHRISADCAITHDTQKVAVISFANLSDNS